MLLLRTSPACAASRPCAATSSPTSRTSCARRSASSAPTPRRCSPGAHRRSALAAQAHGRRPATATPSGSRASSPTCSTSRGSRPASTGVELGAAWPCARGRAGVPPVETRRRRHGVRDRGRRRPRISRPCRLRGARSDPGQPDRQRGEVHAGQGPWVEAPARRRRPPTARAAAPCASRSATTAPGIAQASTASRHLRALLPRRSRPLARMGGARGSASRS